MPLIYMNAQLEGAATVATPYFTLEKSISLGVALVSGSGLFFSRFDVVNSLGAPVLRLQAGVAAKALKSGQNWVILKTNGVLQKIDSQGQDQFLPVKLKYGNINFQVGAIYIKNEFKNYAVCLKSDGTLADGFLDADGETEVNLPSPGSGKFVAVSMANATSSFCVAALSDEGIVRLIYTPGSLPYDPGSWYKVIQVLVVFVRSKLHIFGLTESGDIRIFGLYANRFYSAVALNSGNSSYDRIITRGSESLAAVKIVPHANGIFAICDNGDVIRIIYNQFQPVLAFAAYDGAGDFAVRGDGSVYDVPGGKQTFSDIYPNRLEKIDAIYWSGANSYSAVRADSSIVLIDGATSGTLGAGGRPAVKEILPDSIKIPVYENGDNDFSFTYPEGRNVIPDFVQPLERVVVSATASSYNVGKYKLNFSLLDRSYRFDGAIPDGNLEITPGQPSLSGGVIYLKGGMEYTTAGRVQPLGTGELWSAMADNVISYLIQDPLNRRVTSIEASGLPSWASISSLDAPVKYSGNDYPQNGRADNGSALLPNSNFQLPGFAIVGLAEAGKSTFTLTAHGPGGVSEPVQFELRVSGRGIFIFEAYFSESATIEIILSGADSILADFVTGGILSVGGSWYFYGDTLAALQTNSQLVGRLQTLSLTRFAYGEFNAVPGSRALVFYYTTLNGRITPQPLLGLGVSFFDDDEPEYKEAFIAPRAFDYVSPEGSSVAEAEIQIPANAKHGIYNVWATKDLPPGDVKAHVAINLVR